MCKHHSSRPPGTDLSGLRARFASSHPEQGWFLLCNGVALLMDCR
jgi:hypothetical protein